MALNPFIEIIILIIGTILFGTISEKLGLPQVIGQLLSGIIIGPAMLAWVHQTSLIHFISEAGIFVLMMIAGLEVDLKQMHRYAKSSALIAFLGFIFPMIVFPIVLHFFGFDFKHSLFSGIVFAATSISITLALLSERNQIGSKFGAIILSAAIFDDVIVLGTLILSAVFLNVGNLGFETVSALVAFLLGIFLRKFSILDKPIATIEHIGNWTLYPVFFGSIGLGVNLHDFQKNIVLILILIILAILTKYFGAGLGAKIKHFNNATTNAIGVSMVARGEMALIVSQIGLSGGIINSDAFSIFIVVIIITTLLSALMLKPAFNKLDI